MYALIGQEKNSFPARITWTPPPPLPVKPIFWKNVSYHLWWAVWSAPGERAVPVPGRGGLGGNWSHGMRALPAERMPRHRHIQRAAKLTWRGCLQRWRWYRSCIRWASASRLKNSCQMSADSWLLSIYLWWHRDIDMACMIPYNS